MTWGSPSSSKASSPAVTAGVLFTANPVTGTRTETVIDASAGPGHAVVSGSVNPDHFVTETATGRILLGSPGRKAAGRRRAWTTPRSGNLRRWAIRPSGCSAHPRMWNG